MNTKVLISLTLLIICVNAFARVPLSTVTQATALTGNNYDQLVGKVVSITPDPVEGQWIKLHVVYFDVLVWYRNGAIMPTLGAKVQVLAIYVDEFQYPSETVSIYKGLTWEAAGDESD